jgi:hypothetical protein
MAIPLVMAAYDAAYVAAFLGRSAARSSSRSGALQNRGPGYLQFEETGVPVLRSGMKNAASRPGHEVAFLV